MTSSTKSSVTELVKMFITTTNMTLTTTHTLGGTAEISFHKLMETAGKTELNLTK